MIRLVTRDRPGVLCLQEVPAWALGKLAVWSGMREFGDVAAPPSLGPLPAPARVGQAVTSLHHGVFRSAFEGQANAILLSRELRPLSHEAITLNPRRFRREQARWLGLGAIARLAWGKERRICQAVRFGERGGRTVVVANLHATSYPADRRLADAELLRAAVFADGIARHEDVCVLAGDFNIKIGESQTLARLASDEWGFAPAADRGIDHVLVRGAAASGLTRWPETRRRVEGRLLSDHAPVEVRVR
jgi:hypothetical protein